MVLDKIIYGISVNGEKKKVEGRILEYFKYLDFEKKKRVEGKKYWGKVESKNKRKIISVWRFLEVKWRKEFRGDFLSFWK